MNELYQFEPFRKLPDKFPPGSVEWAEAISCFLQLEVKTLSGGTAWRVRDQIKLIFETKPRPWEIWPKDRPFKTPNDYCRAVTGHDWPVLLMMVVELTDDKELDELRTKMQTELAQAQIEYRSQGTRTDTLPYIVRKLGDRSGDGGNSASYLLRRLARDHADILKQYEQGEFKSVRAAAKAAGLVKELTPFEQVQRLIPKLTDDQLDQTHRIISTTIIERCKLATRFKQVEKRA